MVYLLWSTINSTLRPAEVAWVSHIDLSHRTRKYLPVNHIGFSSGVAHTAGIRNFPDTSETIAHLNIDNSFNLRTTIRHAGVIGLWASPLNGKKAGGKPGPPAMRHTGLGKLGGLINTAVHATKRAPVQ
ncbi:hypothetical protein TcasGA2_TC012272 [Tribolium castaneum]|uniref:Uncharacterized protein n=1 Tax=Tribolium castaneum TaxID=7070 RepID=D6X0I4_TRICA|nr:hypothetical protein TcasGA2_TC012272 [Tribolium castaneum]